MQAVIHSSQQKPRFLAFRLTVAVPGSLASMVTRTGHEFLQTVWQWLSGLPLTFFFAVFDGFWKKRRRSRFFCRFTID